MANFLPEKRGGGGHERALQLWRVKILLPASLPHIRIGATRKLYSVFKCRMFLPAMCRNISLSQFTLPPPFFHCLPPSPRPPQLQVIKPSYVHVLEHHAGYILGGAPHPPPKPKPSSADAPLTHTGTLSPLYPLQRQKCFHKSFSSDVLVLSQTKLFTRNELQKPNPKSLTVR